MYTLKQRSKSVVQKVSENMFIRGVFFEFNINPLSNPTQIHYLRDYVHSSAFVIYVSIKAKVRWKKCCEYYMYLFRVLNPSDCPIQHKFITNKATVYIDTKRKSCAE